MSRPPLDTFTILLGSYLGGLVTAAVSVVPGVSALDSVALGAGFVVFAVVFALGTFRRDLAVTAVRTGWIAPVLFVPMAASTAGLVWIVSDQREPHLSAGIGVLIGAYVAGLIAYLVANRRIIREARATDAVLASWTAAAPRRRRWTVRLALLAGGIAAIGVSFVVHHPLAELLPGLGGALLAFAVLSVRGRQYSILPGGLYTQQTGTLAGQFVPWSRLTGYRVTDDALLVDRWIPFLRFSSTLADIEDIDAVTDALDRAFQSGGDTTDPDGTGLNGTD